MKSIIETDEYVANMNPHFGIRLLRIVSDFAYTLGLGQVEFSKGLVSAVTGTNSRKLSFDEPVEWRRNICDRFISRYLPSANIDRKPKAESKELTPDKEEDSRNKEKAIREERAGRLLAEWKHIEKVVKNSELNDLIDSIVPLGLFLNLKDHVVFPGLKLPKSGTLEWESEVDSRHFREGRRKANRHLSQAKKSKMPKMLEFLNEDTSQIYFWLLLLDEEIQQIATRGKILQEIHEIASKSKTMNGPGEVIEFMDDNFHKVLSRIHYPVKERPRGYRRSG